jgi:hypothetical protein
MVSFSRVSGFIATVPDARVELMVMICLPHITKAVGFAGFRKILFPKFAFNGLVGGMRIPARPETPSDEVGWARPRLQHFQRMNKFRQPPLLQASAIVGAHGREHALLLRRNRSLGRYDAIAPICDGTSVAKHLLVRWPMQVLNASTFEQQSLLAVNNHEDQ